MTVTISRLYDNYAGAQSALQGLESAGVPHSDISIVANNSDNWYRGKKVDRDGDAVDDRAEGAGKGAGIGARLGGAAGLLAVLGLLAIPGLGPVVAAGWLAATAAALLLVLTEAGVSKEEAPLYAEGVRRGGTLVSARCRMVTGLGSTPSLTSPQSICGIEARHGESRDGKPSTRPAKPTMRRKSAKNASYMVAR